MAEPQRDQRDRANVAADTEPEWLPHVSTGRRSPDGLACIIHEG